MAKAKPDSRILKEVREAAAGQRKAGLISKRRMLEFDVLCNLDVDKLSPAQIKALRNKANLSQAVFAAVLNTSTSTVQKWEIGDKQPSGPSLKLLNLIQKKGIESLL